MDSAQAAIKNGVFSSAKNALERGFLLDELTSILYMTRIQVMSSSLLSIGPALRAGRAAMGLSQDALAMTAGISRTTLVQIEKGNDAQVSSVEKVGRVLGVTFGILAESPAMARKRQARSDNQMKLAASREKHLNLAVQFALGGAPARALKDDALQMVQRWEDQQLCSPVYITRWRDILNAEPTQIARNLLAMDDDWGPALRQNTPFAVRAPTP